MNKIKCINVFDLPLLVGDVRRSQHLAMTTGARRAARATPGAVSFKRRATWEDEEPRTGGRFSMEVGRHSSVARSEFSRTQQLLSYQPNIGINKRNVNTKIVQKRNSGFRVQFRYHTKLLNIASGYLFMIIDTYGHFFLIS